MFSQILANAEKATVWVGRYCDLDRAARWRRPALIVGTLGWAGRWALVALLSYDIVREPATVSLIAEAAAAETGATPANKAIFYTAAILSCMAIKWAGWTYGGVGYVHHRAKTAAPRA